jgi:hypothetical protein
VVDGLIHVHQDSELVGWPQQYLPRPGLVQFDEQYRAFGLTMPHGIQTTATWLDADWVIRVRDADHGHTVRRNRPLPSTSSTASTRHDARESPPKTAQTR